MWVRQRGWLKGGIIIPWYTHQSLWRGMAILASTVVEYRGTVSSWNAIRTWYFDIVLELTNFHCLFLFWLESGYQNLALGSILSPSVSCFLQMCHVWALRTSRPILHSRCWENQPEPTENVGIFTPPQKKKKFVAMFSPLLLVFFLNVWARGGRGGKMKCRHCYGIQEGTGKGMLWSSLMSQTLEKTANNIWFTEQINKPRWWYMQTANILASDRYTS